ncbi:F0F1 ATP synthase subunit epsilon [Roseibium sp. RKSG952]|uniref:F0F1 ATP synthase subunit epsilon n=1 Tax=Roseibium sp. RKSG952 TaxID=2529384 RepID=UPI0012BCA35E|nr:F0F1 ATP synthase subunit epsilon [Roseibium sp. RKSG952]MTI00270.1 F0F1 ATP synthase subunit epsilon [Roseibium sp. RKSG952]
MAELFQFELVSPERQLLSEQVLEVIVPGTEGEFGVMKNHAAFMSTIKPGILKVRKNGDGLDEYFVRGGFADVTEAGLTVLAEQATPVTEINADILNQHIKDAEEDVADARDDETRQRAEEHLTQLREVAEALKSA